MANTQPQKLCSLKTKTTIYTDEKRRAMQHNAVHDASVRTATEACVKEADEYLERIDTIYDMVVSEGLFRYYFVGQAYDPNRTVCRYCGTDIAKIGGLYAWLVDPLHDPWKVECPACHRKFPSNDFGSYYRLGLDQQGVFHAEKAKEEHIKLFGGLENVGYLKNELYPEMDEHTDKDGNIVNAGVHGWGVDAGLGYHTINETGCKETHTYIAYYLHDGLWHITGKPEENKGILMRCLKTFKNAYLYTGETQYARAGAILLDRIADFYSDYDWYQWHENRGEQARGKILDPVWECSIADTLAECYDAFYPVYSDDELIAYLSDKAQKQGITAQNPKNTADCLRFNVENGVLRTIFRDAVDNKLAGNFGMDQRCVVAAAVVLDAMPETKQWLDWVMAPGGIQNTGANPPKRTGGRVLPQLINVVDRDGMGNESSPGYNGGWVDSLIKIADLLHGYELYPTVDLLDNPKFVKMLCAHLPVTMVNSYTAQIGDSGSYAVTGISIGLARLIFAYMATGDRMFAQAMYLVNGRSAKGLRYPDYCEDPSKLETEVAAIVEEYGEFDMGSTVQPGYGLLALRDGTQTEEKNTLRDFWIYHGSTAGHGHRDSLNLGISAYGLNLAPELGYPFDTGPEVNRIQWVSATISHNTVVVDEKMQEPLQERGFPMHFDDAGRVKVMDADKSAVYPQTDLYRRTVVMVEANDDVSYGVDFFRIKGGEDHLYSFHAQSHEVAETEGLAPVRQNGGTYAGEDVPYGPDPSPLSGVSWKHNVFTYPDGYTWIDHVEKDLAPQAKFAVDFKISDYHHTLPDASGLHLRMTMAGDTPLDEVSVVNGYPVRRVPNPQTHIKYVLARNKADANGTLFTTVLEPYKDTRYLSGIESVSVVRADGKAIGADETVKAVKVCHTSGRTDYIVYALDNTVEYVVGDLFRFRGFVGVLTYENDAITHAYLHDGDLLADAITGETAAYTGTVADFTQSLSLENTIELSLAQRDADVSDMVGKCINVSNDGEQNAFYEIKSAKRLENGNVLLGIGNMTLIRSYLDQNDMSLGFVYNIERGQSFRIPRSIVK